MYLKGVDGGRFLVGIVAILQLTHMSVRAAAKGETSAKLLKIGGNNRYINRSQSCVK